MFDTTSVSFWIAVVVVVLGIPVAVFEVYYFRIRKRRR
jgi:ABC-type Fe3+ transport system permease subunit